MSARVPPGESTQYIIKHILWASRQAALEVELLACPIMQDPQGNPVHDPISFDAYKEIRKGIRDNGAASPFMGNPEKLKRIMVQLMPAHNVNNFVTHRTSNIAQSSHINSQ